MWKPQPQKTEKWIKDFHSWSTNLTRRSREEEKNWNSNPVTPEEDSEKNENLLILSPKREEEAYNKETLIYNSSPEEDEIATNPNFTREGNAQRNEDVDKQKEESLLEIQKEFLVVKSISKKVCNQKLSINNHTIITSLCEINSRHILIPGAPAWALYRTYSALSFTKKYLR